MAKVFGVRIYLEGTFSADADLGIYSGNEIRWIESDISAYAPTLDWKTGFLIPDWLEPISDSYDGTYGGNGGEVGMGGIRVVSAINYDSNQRNLMKLLNDLGIRFNGCRCDIVEFEIVSGALVVAGGTIFFRGELGGVSGDEKYTKIEIQTAMLNRRANIGTEVNEKDFPHACSETIGNTVPVTFGEYIPELDVKTKKIFGGFARFDRTEDEQTIISGAYFDRYFRYSELKLFPVIGLGDIFGGTTELGVKIKIKGDTFGLAGVITPENFYIRIVEGKGADNSPRKVTTIEKKVGTTDEVNVYFSDYLKTAVDYDDSSEDGRTWIEIVQVYRGYSSDMWPCKAFLNNAGSVITIPELYSFDSEFILFERLADYGYAVRVGSTENNIVDINPVHFTSNSIDACAGFVIMPMNTVYALSSANLSGWGLEAYGNVYKRENGLYISVGSDIRDIPFVFSDIAKTIDRNSTTYARIALDTEAPGFAISNGNNLMAVGFTLPVIDSSFTFEKCYLGIKCHIINSSEPLGDTRLFTVGAKLKRFAYKNSEIFKQLFNGDTADFINSNIECLPDFFFTDAVSTGSRNFYREESPGEEAPLTGDNNLYGYTSFDTGITERKILDSYDEGLLYFIFNIWSTNHEIKIHELAMIYERSADIKLSVFTPYRGRIFNSTFDGNALTTLIDTPKLAIMHLNMLQNWSESGEVKEWGKEYPTTPLVDITTNEGGFNYPELSVLDSLRLRRQIFDYEECWTDSVIDSICRDFFLVPSQNHATGAERISFIGKKHATAPTVTITLDDIIGKVSLISSQDEKAIFCEPFVRYNYNTATEKFDGLIKITNSNAATYSTDYVIGLSGTAAENAWNKAHKLWTVTKKNDVPPTECTDKQWIYRAEDAAWYLDTWLYYMGAVDTELGVEYASRDQLSFDIAIDDGKTYFKGQHINLVLPFHTENVTIECVIEGVTKGREIVRVDVRLLDSITEDDFYIIKTLTGLIGDDEIDKVIPEFGDEKDWEKVI